MSNAFAGVRQLPLVEAIDKGRDRTLGKKGSRQFETAMDPLNLFGGSTPPPPAPKPPAPIPDPEETAAARRRAAARQRTGGGRASTIFTEPGGSTLGGG